MNTLYRAAERENTDELRFVAEEDSKIPLLYDPEYIFNEKSTDARMIFYKQQISNEDFFEVAVENEKIVGFHIVKKVPYPPDLQAGAIITLWSHPDYRGRGIAFKLKQRAEEWAIKSKLAHLQTNVHSNNLRMLSMNEKAGFKIIQVALKKNLGR